MVKAIEAELVILLDMQKIIPKYLKTGSKHDL